MVKFKNFILKLFFVLFMITIFIFTLARSYSKTMFKSISDNFLRLHILANSDSTEDQILKYQIRDAVIQYMSPYLKKTKSKEDAVLIIKNHLEELVQIAEEIVNLSGFNYPVTVHVDNCFFPTKEYGEITLPSGFYDALKIEIGNASGQNWWCVMFPSLCVVDTSNFEFSNCSDKVLRDNLNDEEYSIITNYNESNEIKIKFKLIEFFENL